jgi:membrane glycosyltransferase
MGACKLVSANVKTCASFRLFLIHLYLSLGQVNTKFVSVKRKSFKDFKGVQMLQVGILMFFGKVFRFVSMLILKQQKRLHYEYLQLFLEEYYLKMNV